MGDDPFVEVGVSGSPDHPLQPLACLIDTGFTGAIQIPEEKVRTYGLALQPTATVPMSYGDARPVVRPVVRGIVEIDSIQREVVAVIGYRGTYPLLGIRFLRIFGLRLILDAVRNTVELVPSRRSG